jgi:hypothetical protein
LSDLAQAKELTLQAIGTLEHLTGLAPHHVD